MKKEYGVKEIEEIIPHRHPFLFLDKVIDISDDFNEITAIKAVSFIEPYFAGHFPAKPVMPGVLQVEAIAQAAAFLVLKFDENAKAYNGLALTGIQKMKFRNPVFPGDQLLIKAKVEERRCPFYNLSGLATVNGKIACEGEFQAIFLEKKEVS